MSAVMPPHNSTDQKEVYFEHLLSGDVLAASNLKNELLAKARFLYRYRPLSGHGLKELETGQVYLARPQEFKDPYECQFLLNVTEKVAIRLGSAWSAFYYLEKQIHCAALCEDPRLVLMWAHYANRPQGCCLEFSTVDLMTTGQISLGLHPVIYADRLYDANESLRGVPERLKAIMMRMACHKLRPWAYEREWRLVSLELKEPQNSEWPGMPMSRWAPQFDVNGQSEIIGCVEEKNRFMSLPLPTRIIFLGDKVDPEAERILNGIARLSKVPRALAELTPDAETSSQLEIRDI